MPAATDTIDVLFEARIRIPEQARFEAERQLSRMHPTLHVARSEAVERAVQNALDHTGAQVTCVFEED